MQEHHRPVDSLRSILYGQYAPSVTPAPSASSNRPSRGPGAGKLLRLSRTPSYPACPDRAFPPHAVLHAAFAGRRGVLGEPQAEVGGRSSGVKKVALYFLFSLLALLTATYAHARVSDGPLRHGTRVARPMPGTRPPSGDVTPCIALDVGTSG